MFAASVTLALAITTAVTYRVLRIGDQEAAPRGNVGP